MKTSSKLTIILAAFFLTIILFTINYYQSKVYKKVNTKELYNIDKDINDQLSGKKVPNISCIDSVGKSFKLSKLITEKRILVYYYSELHCSSCYSKEVALLQNFFSETTTSVIILGSYSEYRYFKIYQERNPCKLPIYDVNPNVFNWVISNYGVPYFFILNSDMTVSYFHIPNGSHPEVTQKYLEIVNQLLHEKY